MGAVIVLLAQQEAAAKAIAMEAMRSFITNGMIFCWSLVQTVCMNNERMLKESVDWAREKITAFCHPQPAQVTEESLASSPLFSGSRIDQNRHWAIIH